MPANPDRDQTIQTLLTQGHTQQQVADLLGMSQAAVSRARIRLGLPPKLVSAPTLEEAWRSHTQPTGDGHLLWTAKPAARGQRVFTHRSRQYSAGQVAFRIGHGRDPEGLVLAACGRAGCVEPGHTEDTAMRQRTHTMLRVLRGGGAPGGACRRGHDRAAHGFVDSDGWVRCRECTREDRAADRAA